MEDVKVSDTSQKKLYKLLGADGKFYMSDKPPTFDGWSTGKIDEQTAIAVVYRPCYYCMREKYLEWKKNNQK